MQINGINSTAGNNFAFDTAHRMPPPPPPPMADANRFSQEVSSADTATVDGTAAYGLQGQGAFQGFQGPQGQGGPNGQPPMQGFQGPEGQGGPNGQPPIQGFQGPQGQGGPNGQPPIQGFQGPQGQGGPDDLHNCSEVQGTDDQSSADIFSGSEDIMNLISQLIASLQLSSSGFSDQSGGSFTLDDLFDTQTGTGSFGYY